jgi:ABC-type sugar transport system permease subunit
MAWLYDERTALGALVALHVWKHVGYTVILFLAGLQSIPDSVLEAAKLDGASGLKALWKITLPLLWPTMIFVITVTLINTCQTFDSVYLLTRGGPNNATTLWVFWLVKLAFEQFNIGTAAALGVLLFVLLAGLGLFQRRFQQAA